MRTSTHGQDIGGEQAPTRIRVLVVEDHLAMAEGIAALLAGTPGIEVAGVASSSAQATDLIRAESPDVVLCDLLLGATMAGFDLLRMHGDDTRFLLYTAFDNPYHHVRALELGAAGYISKSADLEEIVRAIRSVSAGGTWFPASVLASARAAPRPPTPREREILALLADGLSNDHIARRLGVAVKTVEGSLRRMFDRYGLDNRTQLARLADVQGWLGPPTTGGGTESRAAHA
jgi:DNA-binding NarL/FixJ family response regulator